MRDGRRFITKEEAKSLLADSPHSFRNPMGMLIGCDVSIEHARGLIDAAASIEIAGGTARSMDHGIALIDAEGKREFLSTDREKLDAFDPVDAGKE